MEIDLVSAFEQQDSRYLDNKIKLAIFFLKQYLYVRHFKHALLLPFHPGIVGWMWMYKPMVSVLMYLKRKTVQSFYFQSLCPQILEPPVQTGGTYSALHPSCCLLVPGWGVGKVAECLWILLKRIMVWCVPKVCWWLMVCVISAKWKHLNASVYVGWKDGRANLCHCPNKELLEVRKSNCLSSVLFLSLCVFSFLRRGVVKDCMWSLDHSILWVHHTAFLG